jgi:hypothetical protein
MLRRLAILLVLVPFITGCAGCTSGQIGGTGSQSLDIGPDGVKPTNDNSYWDGQAMDMRSKH